jgi:cell division protein FtsW (lipid II flippase)/cell division protein FtsI/penicillin-binding protein 2
MAVTRSWEVRVVTEPEAARKTARKAHNREIVWLLGASALVAAGLGLAFLGKTQSFAESAQRLSHGELLDLNKVESADQLLPFLLVFPNQDERALVARRTYDYLRLHQPLLNVGALARLRVSQSEIEEGREWDVLRKQLQDQLSRPAKKPRKGELRLPLLPLAKLKPLLIVRTPREFTIGFAKWMGLYFASFYFVFVLWRWRGFQGDTAILPALHLLSGIGLTLMVSLRDPLRDTLEFSKFSWGVAIGCLALLLPLFKVFRYDRFAAWCYTPLFLAFALFVALLRFGSGPTGNDAKVNLGPFQPVEAIKILIVFFLAGYFARQWERLRDLREKRVRWVEVPRLSHVLPVLLAVGCALLFFFVLKDLGPALVTGFLFVAMFAVARGRAGLAVLGIALLVAGVTVGYRIGKPPTVVERIDMWLSPWDNNVHGGDQLAHAIWAFSTGGPWGSGPGQGDPGMIPAGSTDLVLPAIAEEWGFVGVATIFLLFAFLLHRAFRIALAAADEYGLFLALGLASLIAFEMLLISGGVLGAIPLSGVVSPFLSSGNTAMLANFLIFGLLLSISTRKQKTPGIVSPFRVPVRTLGVVLALCGAALLCTASWYQVAHDERYLARDTHVFEDDGVKRPQHNPRLNSLAHEIVRGNIYDRNGVLLATSDWNELERHRAEYDKLGVNIDQTCSRLDGRHYPFGSATAHFLGDLRTQENFHATNASLIEHDSSARLQGFKDYSELAPLIRVRHQPHNSALQRLLSRDRSVRSTVDIRLQLRAAQLLHDVVAKAKKDNGDKGALVVLNPRTGDVLAMVSEPEVPFTPGRTYGAAPADKNELLDRARYGQYPPGSTFKLVTAMAALRKDPKLADQRFVCRRLGGGRAGTVIPGWRREIKDDIGDSAHGTLTMERAIAVSCNAYFAQLGVFTVGAERLQQTAGMLDIPAGDLGELKKMLPFAAYGQGPVLVTPFKMARVAATVAAGGSMPQGRWVTDESNERTNAPREIVPPDVAGFLARSMRDVVTAGTGRHAFAGEKLLVAGKTGTAQLDEGQPHSWFAGFAPYGADPDHQIAFAVVVEHAGYGATVAAPLARKLIDAAHDLGILP